jgi:hypothetical protein
MICSSLCLLSRRVFVVLAQVSKSWCLSAVGGTSATIASLEDVMEKQPALSFDDEAFTRRRALVMGCLALGLHGCSPLSMTERTLFTGTGMQ